MTLTTEESLTLQLRRRSFQLVLADHRVQGALIASSPRHSPRFAACACCGYPTISFDWYADCAVCDWEAEEFGESQPDAGSGCNSPYSLNGARRNFADGHTMYRPPDERYARAMACATERESIITAHDGLLRNLHPWTFITALPRLKALYDTVRVRRFGERKPRQWRPDIDDDSTSDHDVEVWQTIAAGRRPVAVYRPGPTFVQREQQLFGTIANEVAIGVEARIERGAPVLASDGPWDRSWTDGNRTASIHKPLTGRLLVEFEPEFEEPNPTFDLRDERTPGAIVQRLVAFFESASPTV
jgi:hypothetical protein